MTSPNNFELSSFQEQLSNAIANIFNPDPQLKTLINNFVSISNPNIDDFYNLVSDISAVVADRPIKTKAAFIPINTLLMIEQLHLRFQEFEHQLSLASKHSDEQKTSSSSFKQPIMQCIGKPDNFTLELVTYAPTNPNELFEAMNACKGFANLQGSHWLTLTGETSDCKMFLKSADAYSACLMGF